MVPGDSERAPQAPAEARLVERVEQLETEVARLRAQVPLSGTEDLDSRSPEVPPRGWRRVGLVAAKVLFSVIVLNGMCAQAIGAVREYRGGRLDNASLMAFGFLVSLAIGSVVAVAWKTSGSRRAER
jgi:hypothetical protein